MHGCKNAIKQIASKIDTYERHGFLDRNIRTEIPQCVLAGIRREWTDDLGTCMGFEQQ